ncbi:MAG: hypothetical protein JHC71_06800 [Blastococcus sp.]|nr:hypothetical protein [Blastococcus sp.]
MGNPTGTGVTTGVTPGPRYSARRPGSRTLRRRTVAGAMALMLPLTVATASLADTKVTVRNLGGLTEVGPVNADHGFPSWYGDNRPGNQQIRVEPCLDMENPLCGILPDEVPNPDAPISYPDNFPGEFFYQLAGAELDLPGGGRAVLTLGLEAAWANEVVQNGDQVVFSRTRIVVRDATPNSTLTFKHPFGEVTIDTDAAGDGKLVEDISPSVGNFATPLKGNFGPFLRWDSGAPEGYLGNPDVPHTVTGSPTGYNAFSVSGGGLAVSTDQFNVTGKIATNTGVTGDRAVVNGGFLDVFATSRGTQLEVVGQGGKFSTTPMEYDDGTTRRYARIALTAGAVPTEVVVRNIGDDPVSTTTIPINGITVTKAEYDGTALTVNASTVGSGSLSVEGFGALTGGAGTFTAVAPPASVTVTDGRSRQTVPVNVSGGAASPVGLPPVPPGPDTGPVIETGSGGGTTTPPAVAAVASAASATVTRGGSTTLDGSASTGATSYAWTQVSGPAVTLTGANTAKPTVSVPLTFNATPTPTSPAANTAGGPVVVRLTVNGTATADVTVNVVQDTLTATGRHRVGQELRITGTSLVNGAAAVLSPQTRVVVWNTTGNLRTYLGTATVDTLGAWELRQRPGPSAQISRVQVESSRGGEIATVTVTR